MKRDRPVNFYNPLEKKNYIAKNRDISATIWRISAKFGRVMQNGF